MSVRAAKQHLEEELAALEARHAELDAQLRQLLGIGSQKQQPPDAAVDAEIVEDGLQRLRLCLQQVEAARPDFAALRGAGAALSAQISEGHATAERVSGAVRGLDARRARAAAALTRVDEAVELRGCAEGVRGAMARGDLGAAVHHVRRFHQLDAAALSGSAELAEMAAIQEPLRLVVLEGGGHDMAAVQESLRSVVLSRFEAAVRADSRDGIVAGCPLLGPLGLAAAAKGPFMEFARGLLGSTLAELDAAAPAGAPATHALSALYNSCAAFLQQQVPLAASGLAASCGDVDLLRMVHDECGARAAAVMQRHLRERKVKQQVKEVGSTLA
ncbi:hypothetical protein JKP88DRAFT_322384 [Tribonema minus]|uniref:Conserved oligomeric Golgi complex subunit 4 N-terminal domain-containing protein n=1 Tax=Tribonema minus TaxID=303371 RepID=A0A836CCD6_9STRA|nr:hypothetical protein JKP88DRAFT_322384 [Tribonema minus]